MRDVIYVYDRPQDTRYVLLRGPRVRTWLRAHDIPAVTAPIDRGSKLRRERLPDVLAMAAEAGVKIHMRGDAA